MLASTHALALNLTNPNWLVFDCRHDLGNPAKGAAVYAEAHIPGAHFAHVDRDLAGALSGSNGRHPLPDPQAFADFLAARGATAATQIVAYDDVGGQYAARLWWMARWIGLSRVAVLDGGWSKWVSEARPLSSKVPEWQRGSVTVNLKSAMLASLADVTAAVEGRGGQIVDARAPERYRGEVEPIDKVAGHIPSAVNRFFKANLNPDLTLRTPAELRADFVEILAINVGLASPRA
jgi:thiosulfate/3-mercaptopyruvate sulfurtransferase